MATRRTDVPAGAQPRSAIRRGSLPVTSLASQPPKMTTWKIPHAQDDSAIRERTRSNVPRPVSNQPREDMKYIHRTGPYPQGVHKLVPPTTGFDLKVRPQGRNPSPQPSPMTRAIVQATADVVLPDGTLHVWVYQARHLVFRRLFETMYERHGLRLRVYAGSRTTQDVGEIYETRRNYGGNMANPRWRRDQDDARDDAHGHFSIPLGRPSLRAETELTVEIVCGILVVAHTKISLPALFLGSFGTTLETLAAHNMQFRPHWFPLAGDDSGLIEMALEFIPTRIVKEQQEQQRQAAPLYRTPSPHPSNNQPESEYDDSYDGSSTDHSYDQEYYYHAPPPPPSRKQSQSPEHRPDAERERDRQRAREYEELERREQLRRQRFEMLEDSRDTHRTRSVTTASSSSSSSARSTRFNLPRRRSVSDLHGQEDGPMQYHHSPQYDFEDHHYGLEGLVIMDGYDNSPPPSEFSGYELHDSQYDEPAVVALPCDDQNEPRSSTGSDYYDDVSLSASSSWASASTVDDSSQENLQNKQLWDLYRYGISDEAPEEIDTSRGRGTSVDSSLRDSSMSMDSATSSFVSRKMSTMSQASNYSIAFSDASEASMLSREASTCASEILTYNDRIQRMEEAIRMARERRAADEAGTSAPVGPAGALPRPPPPTTQPETWTKPHVPAQISTTMQVNKPTASLTAFGWERRPPAPPSPATSEPVVVESRKGVVLFDMDHIPVKGRSGQTDPALEAYRAKMLARRRSLPIHMLSGGGPNNGFVHGLNGRPGIPPHLSREVSAPTGRLSITGPEPSWPMPPPVRDDPPPYDSHMWEWHTNQLHESPRSTRPVGVVDSPITRVPKKQSYEEPVRSMRPSDNERNSTSSIDDLPGPPGLNRKRSSSLHSISDLLRDQSFRIHNIAISSSPGAQTPVSHAASRPSSRPSFSDRSIGRTSTGSGDRKLSKASSYASSDASSNNSHQVFPTSNSSSAPQRVRRNSKGGGNVLQVNGVALGIGKFIHVGNVPGVIRYIGPTMFAPGQWIGIELVEKKGKHNGTVQNVQYFECAPEHGIFIRAERLDIST